jgi:hypothetical protein
VGSMPRAERERVDERLDDYRVEDRTVKALEY